jgi:hypothetical protein
MSSIFANYPVIRVEELPQKDIQTFGLKQATSFGRNAGPLDAREEIRGHCLED